jgi:nicotinate-nucleotide pyrophosphorylase (carboxylating)
MPAIEFGPAEHTAAARLVELALAEDFGGGRDVTSDSLIPAERQAEVQVTARSHGVLAGLPVGEMVFARLDRQVSWEPQYSDGTAVIPGQAVAVVRGPLRSLLGGERTCLNFLTHLSGIATLTAQFVEQVSGTQAVILDTRKTIPGWRVLHKYAVRAGGGTNHRMGLYDGILIKDNHLAAWCESQQSAGDEQSAQTGDAQGLLGRAVQASRSHTGGSLPVEIEVDTLEQLADALIAGPEIVLLDNMSPGQLQEAVRLRDEQSPGTRLEASGGVTLEAVAEIAATGIDRISAGSLTHSAPALDIAFDWKSA